MRQLLKLVDYVKKQLQQYFVAKENEPQIVRKKHLRIGIVLIIAFLASCYFIVEATSKNKRPSNFVNKKEVASNPTKIEIEELAKGTTNESLWVNKAEADIESVKQKQLETLEAQKQLREQVEADKVSREELAEVITSVQAELEEKYNKRLAEELSKIGQQEVIKPLGNQLESKSFARKVKIKRVGDYVPAGSYVEAKLISGVDAGVGMSAEADPRHVLLRVTGQLVSAGFGAEYIKSDRLVGCILQAQATGDISSEKAYLKAVLLTCAKDRATVIEMSVKGYVSSKGKVGIRGEIVSREGDMVLKSFLSGAIGGFGSGVAQYSQPHLGVSGGLLTTEGQTAKNIAIGGLGSGLSGSSDRLSEYFIKRAEQYQPVISVNEGAEVHVVFQEGFSLKEEEERDGKSKK